MPRRVRLSLSGIPWHIIQRGNHRAVCFYTEEDDQFCLDHLTRCFNIDLGFRACEIIQLHVSRMSFQCIMRV